MPPSPAALSGTMAELTFPASDPLENTPERGVTLDPAPLHQAAPAGPAIRGLLVAGLRAAYGMEMSAHGWAPALADITASPALRAFLDGLRDHSAYRAEQAQRALACFGASHDPALPPAPAAIRAAMLHGGDGPAADLAAALAAHAACSAARSAFATLHALAGPAGLTDPLPFLGDCMSSHHGDSTALGQLIVCELVPAAAAPSVPSLPASLARALFTTEAEGGA